MIQSDGYDSVEDYSKQSILTSSFSRSLFTISGTSHLQLLGLHFDNLNPTSNNPLILISLTNDNKNPEVIFKDCIFEQINPESISLSHTLIKVSGGHFIVENTIIQNYEFENAQRVIELIGSGQYQVDIINSEFKNISQVGTSGADGGAVIKSDQDYYRNFMVKDCIFTDIYTDGNGGAINSAGLYGTIQVYGTIFTRCVGRNGGAFYVNKAVFTYITKDDYCEFKDCESNSQNEEEGGGAVCIIFQISSCELLIRNCLFDSCKGNNNKGGALHMTLFRSVSVIDGVQFKNCQGSSGGAISYVGNDNNILNINGSTSFTSCSSLSNPGGAIHSILNNGVIALIENTQFESCNSANSDGGSIFAQINNESLSINKVRFIGSSCSQPGSGGAIAIVQQNSNSRISITESSFINCQTLSGSSSRYGWGGAIYISTLILATELSSTNFLLTNLSFLECSASGAGNNLHIRSANTYNTGIAIVVNSLLTIKDLTDLYKNEQYSKDYMGIDESNVNNGNAPYSDHKALFLAGQLGFITKEYYIQSDNFDLNECSSSSPCKTINYILSKSLPTGFVKGLSISIINLLSETCDQTNMIISSETQHNNIITIQSDGFISKGTEYTKYSILTSLFDATLFTISNTGRLKLFGLHFDNLNPSSTNPLISIQSDNRENPEVTIKDCIFEQINPEMNSLSHSLIKVSGGPFIVENTIIQNYEFINGQRVIDYDSSRQYLVDIVNSEFKNINQICTSSNDGGAAISGNDIVEVLLRIRDQSKFNNITSNENGGAIYITGYYITIEINRVSFIKCKGISGGAIFVYSFLHFSFTIENQSEFKQCEIIGNNEEQGGGAIYLMQTWGYRDNQFNIRNSIFEECKGNNNRGGALQITLTDTQSVIDGVQFINCQGSRGGSICGIIQNSNALIENTQFESSNSNSDGGSIFAQIDDYGSLSINQTRFIGSSCRQPGSGGAIAIVQQNSNSYISITESSFTNCKTLPGSSRYGWGGAIYISTLITATDLSSTNFQLIQLNFTNCKASGAGNNLHILSDDTTAVGNQIKTGSLLTVKDLSDPPNIISDLYTNEWYCFDYMGINQSKVGDGYALFTVHEPLFISPSLTPKFNDPYVVDAEYGKDHPICGNTRLKCYTIKYILNIDRTQVIEYPSNLATINIELQSNTQLENGIMIDSNTPIGNNFKIQSSGYTSGGTDYIKRQIQTSSFSSSLFTISGTSHLELLGLHFDNLNPSSTAPLISTSQSYYRQNPQVTIKDCIFEQINPQSNSLSHSLIITSGGALLIENTLIQNYEFINGQRFIELGQTGFYLVDVVNTEFNNIHQVTNNQQGGAAISGNFDYGNILRIRDQCKFNNITSNGNGGAIYCRGEIFNIEINRVSFIKCKGISSGAIFASSEVRLSFTIENQSEFKQCEIFGNDENQGGGAIYLITLERGYDNNQFNIRNSVFEECKGNNNKGGALQITLKNLKNTFNIDGLQFINCQGSSGGAINYQSEGSKLTIKGSSSFTSCSSISNPGGAIHSILNNGESTLIENSQFESCNSANSDGGSIFASINNESLSINQVRFIGSSCSQPGSGGAIAIVQQNSNSYISITESSFTNCKTLPGSSNQYGWGGAIYINISYNPPSLTATNFQLTDLSFTNCKASGAGNNLHILSPDSHATGQVIKNENFLTVKDQYYQPNIIYDLYTSPQYAYDYMGINESIETDNLGTIDLDHHNPLFEQLFISNVPNPSYIDAFNGKDIKFCGWQSSKCKTTKYATERNPTPLSGIIPTDSTYSIILTSNTESDTDIQIMSTTLLKGHVVIQTEGYNPIEDYTKQSILTSSFSRSLFTITGNGHLELLGLHFDNLQSLSNNPLISISIDSDDTPQLLIEDCEFIQESDSYSAYSLSHSIISISGGIMKMERTMIESYKLINDTSVINIKQGAEEVSILNCSLRNIQKNGENIGGIIELYKNIGTQNEEQQMNVRIETSSFIQPIGTISSNIAISSPFIHASFGKLEIISCSFGSEDEFSQLGSFTISIEAECSKLIISNTNFTKLLSGGISLETGQGSQASIESCQFTNCGNGSQIAGAVYAVGLPGDNLGSVSITDSQFILCSGQLAGGIILGDNVIPLNMKNNSFSMNSITDEKGANDIYFLSKEMLDKAGDLEIVAQGYKYDKTDGFVGEVKISGFDANFAQYLDCKSEGKEDCGEIPCGGTKEQTVKSCKETIKEEEIKEKKKLSGGAIAGIVIGEVVVIVAIAIIKIVVVIYKKKNNQNSKKHGGSSLEMNANRW
ncbi:MAG: hypothetical protein EZS28_008178 [Streblomastix strix]|uniref:Uncharacterized protein n=1 Tax=Streblomastix strix TaxID=222440 RepID=A0A5J4WNA9_9EUKA|nr:MAG: hypothetical protein EZS28_008178 [Streblomastix strix]